MAQKRPGNLNFGGFSLNSKKLKVNPSQLTEDEDLKKQNEEKESKLNSKRILMKLSEEESQNYLPKNNMIDEEPADLEENTSSSRYSKINFVPSEGKKEFPSNQTIPNQEELDYENYLDNMLSKPKTSQEEEDDTLDSFMQDINKEIKENTTSQPKVRRDDIEEEDDMESFLKHRKELEEKGLLSTSEEIGKKSEEDEEDEESEEKKKKIVPILPPLDHSKIKYEDFNRDFYQEHPEISSMSEEEVTEYRRSLDIHVFGYQVPKLCKHFTHFGFDETLLSVIKSEGFVEPTSIQKQAVPAVLSGRDVISIAKTGSGKTAAYIWPMIVHIMDQPELEKGEGPIAVLVAPTRELAEQIFKETRKYTKGYGIKCAPIYSGLSKLDQIKLLKTGCEVVVCTPVHSSFFHYFFN